MIEKRQKHIKVADRSEYGWVTVGVCEDDALADDSEDEKKLERAEKEAEGSPTSGVEGPVQRRGNVHESQSRPPWVQAEFN